MDASSGTSSVGVMAGESKSEAASEEVLELIAGLTPPKRTAIDALMVGHSVTRAAELAGRHRGTLSRWIAEDAEFNAALNALEREAIRVGNIRVMSLIPTAIMMIENALNKGDVRAAYQLLKLALYSRRQIGSMSPALVAREMRVAELEREATLQKQRADFLETTEAAIERGKTAARKATWRKSLEARYGSPLDDEATKARHQAAEAKANPSPKPPAAAAAPAPATPVAPAASPASASPNATPGQAKNPTAASVSGIGANPVTATQPANPPQSFAPGSAAPAASGANPGTLPASKHPGQSIASNADPRIAAAARAAAGAMSIPGLTPIDVRGTSPDVAPSSTANPGKVESGEGKPPQEKGRDSSN